METPQATQKAPKGLWNVPEAFSSFSRVSKMFPEGSPNTQLIQRSSRKPKKNTEAPGGFHRLLEAPHAPGSLQKFSKSLDSQGVTSPLHMSEEPLQSHSIKVGGCMQSVVAAPLPLLIVHVVVFVVLVVFLLVLVIFIAVIVTAAFAVAEVVAIAVLVG